MIPIELYAVRVDVNFNKSKYTNSSTTVFRSFLSEWQHTTNIWEKIPALYHSILLHFNLSLLF